MQVPSCNRRSKPRRRSHPRDLRARSIAAARSAHPQASTQLAHGKLRPAQLQRKPGTQQCAQPLALCRRYRPSPSSKSRSVFRMSSSLPSRCIRRADAPVLRWSWPSASPGPLRGSRKALHDLMDYPAPVLRVHPGLLRLQFGRPEAMLGEGSKAACSLRLQHSGPAKMWSVGQTGKLQIVGNRLKLQRHTGHLFQRELRRRPIFQLQFH